MGGGAAAIGLMGTAIPMIVATWGVTKVMNVAFQDKNGKPVGVTHYHRNTSKKVVSHRHTQGGKVHEHRGLRGYGKTRKTFKLKR